jgi:hypothetical protein
MDLRTLAVKQIRNELERVIVVWAELTLFQWVARILVLTPLMSEVDTDQVNRVVLEHVKNVEGNFGRPAEIHFLKGHFDLQKVDVLVAAKGHIDSSSITHFIDFVNGA